MKRKVVFVQPTLAPYAKTRFEELAKDKDLDIYLLFEHETLEHRKGWKVTEVEGCKTIIIGGYNKKRKIYKPDLNCHMEGIRGIPYTLSKHLLTINPNIVVVCNATQLFFVNIVKPFLNFKTGIVVEDTIHANKGRSNFNKMLKSTALKFVDFYLPYSNDAVDFLNYNRIYKNIFRTSWSMKPELFDINDSKNNSVKLISADLKSMDKIIFICVTQLIPRKGMKNLFQAWNLLENKIKSNIELIVLGDGPQKEELLNIIKHNNIDNIHLLGNKEYQEVTIYLKEADVFILPTLEDLFSLVVMEAMSSSLPVLTSTNNGARELIYEGENGYVFDAEDISNIKLAIEKIYADRFRLKQMGKKSYEIISEYSNEKVMSKLAKILKEI